MKGVYLLLVIFAGLCLPSAQGQTRRGSVKYGVTLPPSIESGEAFPPSRHKPQAAPPSSAPRQTSNGVKRLSASPAADQPNQSVDTQQRPRYRLANRFLSAKKIASPNEDAPQTVPNESKPTQRLFRTRPTLLRTTPRALIDPINDSPNNNEPGQPLLQRSISNQNGKPANQFPLRKIKSRPVNGGRATEKLEESEASPSKPTRRTFTRKLAVPSTTPANVRVTKRYYKKNGSNVEQTTSSTEASSTTEATVKPFRVATRHQKQLKQKNHTPKTAKKFDDDDGEDNYPEHFKLLLKSQPEAEPKVKKVKAVKAYRSSPRVENENPQNPSEKPVHSVLRTRQRPLFKKTSPAIVSTTTETPIITNPTLAVPEEGHLNLIEEEQRLQNENQEGTRFSTPTHREGRTQIQNQFNEVPSRNERLLELSPRKFSAKYRSEEDLNNSQELDEVEPFDTFYRENQFDQITTAAPLPPLYEPTVPPASATASHQQQQQSASDNKQYMSGADVFPAPATGVGSGFYWREFGAGDDQQVEPVRAGLMLSHINVETSNHSPSVTVSIFGALAEVLSHTEHSTNSIDQATTPSTTSTTSTTTTTTTTTTTPPPPTTTEQVQDIAIASPSAFPLPEADNSPSNAPQQTTISTVPLEDTPQKVTESVVNTHLTQSPQSSPISNDPLISSGLTLVNTTTETSPESDVSDDEPVVLSQNSTVHDMEMLPLAMEDERIIPINTTNTPPNETAVETKLINSIGEIKFNETEGDVVGVQEKLLTPDINFRSISGNIGGQLYNLKVDESELVFDKADMINLLLKRIAEKMNLDENEKKLVTVKTQKEDINIETTVGTLLISSSTQNSTILISETETTTENSDPDGSLALLTEIPADSSIQTTTVESEDPITETIKLSETDPTDRSTDKSVQEGPLVFSTENPAAFIYNEKTTVDNESITETIKLSESVSETTTENSDQEDSFVKSTEIPADFLNIQSTTVESEPIPIMASEVMITANVEENHNYENPMKGVSEDPESILKQTEKSDQEDSFQSTEIPADFLNIKTTTVESEPITEIATEVMITVNEEEQHNNLKVLKAVSETQNSFLKQNLTTTTGLPAESSISEIEFTTSISKLDIPTTLDMKEVSESADASETKITTTEAKPSTTTEKPHESLESTTNRVVTIKSLSIGIGSTVNPRRVKSKITKTSSSRNKPINISSSTPPNGSPHEMQLFTEMIKRIMSFFNPPTTINPTRDGKSMKSNSSSQNLNDKRSSNKTRKINEKKLKASSTRKPSVETSSIKLENLETLQPISNLKMEVLTSTPIFSSHNKNHLETSTIIQEDQTQTDENITEMTTESSILETTTLVKVISTQSNSQTIPFKSFSVSDFILSRNFESTNLTVDLLTTTPEETHVNTTVTNINTEEITETNTQTMEKTSTTTEQYKSRFGDDRMPIRPLIIATTTSESPDYPVEASTPKEVPTRNRDYVVFGILPNNTVVKKYPEPEDDTDKEIVIYGILANNTMVRKYLNGTIVPANSRRNRVLITDIEPRALFNPHSEVYRADQQRDPDIKTTPVPVIDNIIKRWSKTEEGRSKTDNIFSLVPNSRKHQHQMPDVENTRNNSIKDIIDSTTHKEEESLNEIDNEIAPKAENNIEVTTLKKALDSLITKLPSDMITTPQMLTTEGEGETTKTPLVIDNERDFLERNVMLLQELLGLPVASTTSAEQKQESTSSPGNDMATFPPTEKYRMGRGPNYDEEGPSANGVNNAIEETLGYQTPRGSLHETTIRDQVTETPTTTVKEPEITSEEDKMETSTTERTTTSTSTTERTTTSTAPPTTEMRIETTTTTTTSRRPSPTSTSTERLTTKTMIVMPETTPTTERTTTESSSTESITTESTTRKPTKPSKKNNDADDIAFLKQLQKLLSTVDNPPKENSTKAPELTTTSTTTTTETPSTTTTTTVAPPKPTTLSTYDLLLALNNVESPTGRIPTTHSDQEDLDFLNNLRKFAKLIPDRPTIKKSTTTTTTSTTQTPTTTKRATTKATTRAPKGPITDKDFKQEQQDIAQIGSDLALLSSLLGRQVSIADLPELTKSFGIPPPPPSLTKPIKSSPVVAQNEVINQVDPGNDKTRVKSEIDSGVPKIKPETFDNYGKTDDALLASLLKQNGIGPANNNIPVQLLLHQVMGAASTPFSRSSNQPTESFKPSTDAPARRPRPIIDGLSWLWRTWQETAPKKKRPVSSDLTLGPDFSNEEYTQGNDFPPNPVNDPLPISYDTSGGLISTAINFTQTVSKFLASAFQGVQTAFAPAASTGGGAAAAAAGGGGAQDGRLFSLSG